MASLAPLTPHDFNRLRIKADLPDESEETVEDVMILWFDQYMDEVDNAKDVEITKTSLREINDYVLFFSKPDPCIEYIKSVSKEKIFLITTGSYANQYLDQIHHLQQIDSVFIFCAFRKNYLSLKGKYLKIVDVFTEQPDLVESITYHIDLLSKQPTVIKLFDGTQNSTRYLTRESASFLWFQLFTDVLKNIALADKTNTGINEMLAHCQSYYRVNRLESNNIDEFKKKYTPKNAIFWYSRQSFVYRLVNKALRTEDIDALYTFRVYITHLRTQIAQEHEKLRRTFCNAKSSIINLYRGLKMTDGELKQMADNVGGIISMNGFLSTSKDVERAVKFATKKSHRTDVVGVLLEISGDVDHDQLIFADIAEISFYPKEKEVLFDLATIFKIVHVELDKGRNLWVIQLSGVEKSSYTVNEYIKSIGKEREESNPILLLSRLMCDMSDYDKSEKYLKRLLSNIPPNPNDISKIYFHLGRVCYLRGEYRQALDYYDKAIDLQKREIAPNENSFDIALTLHSIADIYLNQKQISKALEYYKRALEMKCIALAEHPDQSSIATTLTAIGLVYCRQGDLRRALELCQKSYKIKKLSLVPDHPSLADSLNSLGIIYQEMDDLEQALDCFGDALNIQQKTLPPTHPSISVTFNNMGIVYRKKGDHDKALNYHTQALQIQQAKLSSDNLDLADTYDNLYTLYYDISDYEKALEMAQCKLSIFKNNFDDDDEQVKSTKETINKIIEKIKQPSNSSFEVYF